MYWRFVKDYIISLPLIEKIINKSFFHFLPVFIKVENAENIIVLWKLIKKRKWRKAISHFLSLISCQKTINSKNQERPKSNSLDRDKADLSHFRKNKKSCAKLFFANFFAKVKNWKKLTYLLWSGRGKDIWPPTTTLPALFKYCSTHFH